MRHLWRLVFLLSVAAVALLAMAGPASAHATVVRSDPADGADLTRAPASVSITFDEPVELQPGYLQVIDDTGRRVDTGPAAHPGGDGTTITVALRSGLTASAGYLASYRVVSADSHPVSGVVRFTVGGGNPVSRTPVTSRTSATVLTLLDVATTVQYLGLALAGGVWLLVSGRAGVLDSARGRAVVRTGLVVAAGATLGQLLLQGPYAAGRGINHAFDPGLWTDTLATAYGHWHLVTLAGLVVLLGTSRLLGRWTTHLAGPRRAVVAGAALVWLLTLLGVAATGHAGVQAPVWWGLPVTTLHVLAMTTWTGGLVVLVTVVIPLAHRDPATRSAVPSAAVPSAAVLSAAVPSAAVPPAAVPPAEQLLLQRFSGVALVGVAVLAVTGTYQAWVETRSWAALATTTYGVLVLIKVGLFGVLVGLGALARRHVRRADHPRSLRTGVLVEVGVLVAVLAVTGVLVTEPPAKQARAVAQATAPAAATVTFGPARSARVEVDPAHTGAAEVTVTLTGVPTVQTLGVTAALPSAQIGPVPVPLTAVPGRPDRYRAEGVELPAAGRWTFELTLRTSEFDAVVADATVTIR